MSFAQAETVPHRSLRTPLAVHGLWPVGMAADISPALPDGGQQGRDQGLPTGFAGASRGKQRGKCCRLLSGMTGHPLPSLPLSPVGSGHAAFHSISHHVAWSGHAVPRLCGYGRQRWEKRGRASYFCPAQPL